MHETVMFVVVKENHTNSIIIEQHNICDHIIEVGNCDIHVDDKELRNKDNLCS